VSAEDAEDRALASAVVRSGDEAAFRVLYRRHTPALYRLALRLGGGDDDWADELVQRAWIRAVESLGEFAWRSAFRTWLSGIALNCAREQWRTQRVAPEVTWGPNIAEASVADPGLRLDLERAIARLPDGYRQVFVLHDVEGFTHEEIARTLGIEPGTSKSQLSHARRRLRELLAPTGPLSSEGATDERREW
jgi:RNA polymerase sigma-70 factor (ECF subfamily)